MEEDLIAHLLASSGLTALVSTRIWWNAKPQGQAAPYVLLHRVSGAPDYTYDGPSGWADALIQIDCWATTFTSALAVRRAVITALHTADSPPTFQGVFVQSQRDSFEQGEGTDTVLHRAGLDARFCFTA